MPYTADISRSNPGCFLFLIDQSGSMTQALAGQPGLRKMEQAAETLNRTLDSISQRCSQGLEVRDYFHIGAMGYRTDSNGNSLVQSLLPDTTTRQPFLSISRVVDLARIEERTVRESDGAGGLVEVTRRVPVWVQPAAEYGTPMCEALDLASAALEEWVGEHPASFPPIVINVSDGMATDGNPMPFAERIMALTTADGNALVFNVHLAEAAALPVQFPASGRNLPDEFAEILFRMSSVLPASCRSIAASLGFELADDSRGFTFNANLEALVQFLEIGTRGATDLRLH